MMGEVERSKSKHQIYNDNNFWMYLHILSFYFKKILFSTASKQTARLVLLSPKCEILVKVGISFTKQASRELDWTVNNKHNYRNANENLYLKYTM